MKFFTTQHFVESPYATYEKMRGKQPVHPVAAGIWLLTRYEDAAAALLDKRLSNRPAPYALVHARNRDVFVAADVAQHLIAFRDAPDATQPRRVLATELQAFCRGRKSSLDDLAADLVAPLKAGTPCSN